MEVGIVITENVVPVSRDVACFIGLNGPGISHQ